MDYSSLGSNVHGILQARILEWVAMPSSRGSSWPRDQSCLFPKISQIMSQISPLPSSRVIVCFFFFSWVALHLLEEYTACDSKLRVFEGLGFSPSMSCIINVWRRNVAGVLENLVKIVKSLFRKIDYSIPNLVFTSPVLYSELNSHAFPLTIGASISSSMLTKLEAHGLGPCLFSERASPISTKCLHPWHLFCPWLSFLCSFCGWDFLILEISMQISPLPRMTFPDIQWAVAPSHLMHPVIPHQFI